MRTKQETLDLLIDIKSRLSNVNEEHFDYSCWRTKCGTAACIGGWCTVWYHDEGLRMGNINGNGIVMFNGQTGAGALADWAGLSPSQSAFLFLGSAYTSPAIGSYCGLIENLGIHKALERLDVLINDYKYFVGKETKELEKSYVAECESV